MNGKTVEELRRRISEIETGLMELVANVEIIGEIDQDHNMIIGERESIDQAVERQGKMDTLLVEKREIENMLGMEKRLATMNSMLKISKYVLFIPKEDGSFVIANTINDFAILIDDGAYIKDLHELISAQQSKSAFRFDENSDMHTLFLDNGVFLDEKVDEYQLALYSYERKLVKDNTLNVMLITSRQCNLRCIYCYEDFKPYHMKGFVYDESIKYIEGIIKEKRCNSVVINLFGGEPFLPFNDVIDFLKRTNAKCEEHGIPFAAQATTNFALVTPERFEELMKVGCRHFQVTLDGLARTHDQRRMRKDGCGSFQNIVDNLLAAKKTAHDFHFNIRTNFDEEVVSDAEEFYSFIKENFDDERFDISYVSIKKFGGAHDDTYDVLEKNDEMKASLKICSILADKGLNNMNTGALTSPFSHVCYANKHNNLIIDYDGTIRKCTLLLDDDEINRIGALHSDGAVEFNHEKHSAWVCRHTRFYPECKDCAVFPICFGGKCVVPLIKGQESDCNKDLVRTEIEELYKQLA